MITYRKLAGSTDVSVVIRIVDSTDGTPETGVVFNTAGIDLEYRRETEATTDITEATLAALTTAHTDGGFLHIGNGYYRLDLPDAACATGVAGVLIHGTVTGMVVIGCYVQLDLAPSDLRQISGSNVSTTTAQLGVNVVQLSADATAADNAEAFFDGTGYAGTNNVIPTTTTVTNGVNVTSISGDSTAADNLETLLDDTAGAVRWVGIIDQGTAQSATGTTLVLRAGAAFADDELIGATIQISGGTLGVGQSRLITDYVSATDTATVAAWTTTPTGTITYRIFGTAPSSGGSGPTAAEVADAVWDEAQADHVAAGSFGEVATEVASVLQDTAEIGAAGAGLTNINLPNQTMDIVGNITGNLSGSVGSVTGAVGSVTGNVGGNVAGSVGSVTGAVGSVTGAVGSVTGAVGSVTGAVGSVGAGGIAAATFAAGAIDAAALAASAGTEIAAAVLAAAAADPIDANVEQINTITITGDGQVGTEFGVA